MGLCANIRIPACFWQCLLVQQLALGPNFQVFRYTRPVKQAGAAKNPYLRLPNRA